MCIRDRVYANPAVIKDWKTKTNGSKYTHGKKNTINLVICCCISARSRGQNPRLISLLFS